MSLLALLLPATARAACSVPNTFQPGTVASAEQVNANFNALIGCVNQAAAAAGATTEVPNNAQLVALASPTAGLVVLRAGFNVAGDGGAATYVFNTSACTLNSGAGDNGAQVKPAAGGGCWSILPQTAYDARIWGLVCDGVTDATAAINAAVSAFSAGSTVVLPNCLIIVNGQVSLPNNVHLTGSTGDYFPGMFAIAGWAGQGSPVNSWPPNTSTAVQCGSVTQQCILINNTSGIEIDHINFGYVQPTPSGGGPYVPTVYPYTILAQGIFNALNFHDLTFTAATNCIDFEGPNNYNGGAWAAGISLSRIFFNPCMNEALKLHNIDQTARLDDIRYDFWWFRNTNNNQVFNYTMSHEIGMEMDYVANAQINNIEFAFINTGIQVNNSSITGGFGTITFATNVLQMNNVSWNETCKGITNPNGNATFYSGSMSNVIAYPDTTNRCPGLAGNHVFFDFGSDGAAWFMHNIFAGFFDTFASIGGGLSGSLNVTNLDVGAYSCFDAAQPAFIVNKNSSFVLTDTPLRAIRLPPATSNPTCPSLAAAAGPLTGPGSAGQGYAEPFQIGANESTVISSVDGGVTLNSSGQPGFAGYVGFILPNGNRNGFVGFSQGAVGTSLAADNGTVFLKPNISVPNAPNLAVGSTGTTLDVNVSGIPNAPVAPPGAAYLCIDSLGFVYTKASCP